MGLRFRLSLQSINLALFLAGLCSLAIVTSGFAACTNDSDSAKKASDFIGNPSAFLNGPSGPRSTDEITNDVENFVSANPQALPVVLSILKDLTTKGAATSDLQKAIGTGLGKAANNCKTTDLAFAAEIQGNLGATGSSDANTQYAAITGNDPTRSVALSGAASGSPGSVGGGTGPQASAAGGNSAFQAFLANSVSNIPTNYFTGSASGAGAAGSGTTTTTIICTVSNSC